MAKDQKVTLHITLSDGTTKDLSFTVPAGESVPQVIQDPVFEMVSDPTDRTAVYARWQAEAAAAQTETKIIMWTEVNDALTPAAPPSTAFLFIEPTEGGKYITRSGEAFGNTYQPTTIKEWSNADNSDGYQAWEMTDTYRRGDGETVTGDGTNREGLYAVKVSTKAGNGLSIDEENGGLFAAAGGGGMDAVTVEGTTLTGSGTVASPLSIVIDPNPSNLVSGDSGLLVLPPAVQVEAGLSGNGTEESKLRVALSDNAKNALSIVDGELYGEAFVIDLPAGTVLTTVTAPGRYRIKGEANGGANGGALQGFPVSVYTNSEVYMDVVKTQSNSAGTNPIITQYFYATLLTNRPGPYVRTLANAAWSAWSPLTTESWTKANMVNWGNVSQGNLSLIPTYNIPTFYAYKKSDGTNQTPEAKTLPSDLPGVVFQMPWPWSTSVAGTFSGVVMAMDSAGDLFINIDNNYPIDENVTPDTAIDWHKFIWVPKDWEPPTIPQLDPATATTAQIVGVLNQIREVLGAAGLTSEGGV